MFCRPVTEEQGWECEGWDRWRIVRGGECGLLVLLVLQENVPLLAKSFDGCLDHGKCGVARVSFGQSLITDFLVLCISSLVVAE